MWRKRRHRTTFRRSLFGMLPTTWNCWTLTPVTESCLCKGGCWSSKYRIYPKKGSWTVAEEIKYCKHSNALVFRAILLQYTVRRAKAQCSLQLRPTTTHLPCRNTFAFSMSKNERHLVSHHRRVQCCYTAFEAYHRCQIANRKSTIWGLPPGPTISFRRANQILEFEAYYLFLGGQIILSHYEAYHIVVRASPIEIGPNASPFG